MSSSVTVRSDCSCECHCLFPHVGSAVIRTKWGDGDWAPALANANLHVDPLPKLLLRAPTDRPSHTNPHLLTKVGFQYVIAHKQASGFYWNKTGFGSHIPGNQYPVDSQVISHVPSLKKAKMLRLPGRAGVARPQENSPEEVSVRGNNIDRECN